MGKKSRKKKRHKKRGRPDFTHPSVIQQSIAAGRHSFTAGDWREVISTWQPLVDAGVTLDEEVQQEIGTKLAHAHFAHGLHFYAQVNSAAALSEMHMATRLQPDDLRYRYHLGLAYHRNGNLTQAIELYQEVLDRNPDHRRARHQLELACLEAGETEVAATSKTSPVVRHVTAGDYHAALETLGNDVPPSVQMTLSFGDTDVQEDVEESSRNDTVDPVRVGQRGLLALGLGDSVRAERLIEEALAGLPQTTFTVYLRYAQGILNARSGKFSEAITAFEAAIEGGLDTPDIRGMVWQAYHHRAQQQAAAGHLRQAAALWGKAAQWRPNDKVAIENQARAYLHLGCQYWANDEVEKAEHEWERALAIDPQNPDALHNLALAAERLELWEEANAYWERLLRAWRSRAKKDESIWVQRHVWVHRRRVENWYRVQDAYEAEKDYKAALRWAPDDVDLLLEVADFYGQLDELLSAERYFNRALAVAPGHATAATGLAEVLQAQGKSAGAAEVWETLMDKDLKGRKGLEQWRSALLDEGMQHLEDEEFGAATDCFERILARDPNFVPALASRGLVELIRGGLQDARPWFDRALHVEHPETDAWQAYVKIGEALYLLGHEKEAKTFFDRAEALSDHPYLFLQLAKIFADDGRKRLVSRYCERAVGAAADDDIEVILLAGMCCVEAGNKSAAKRYLRQARHVDPFDPRVYELKEMIAEEFGNG